MDSFDTVIVRAREAVASLEAVRRSVRGGDIDLDALDRRINHAKLAATHAQQARQHLRSALGEDAQRPPPGARDDAQNEALCAEN